MEEKISSSFALRNPDPQSDEICSFMQQMGLPALRIVPDTMEVAGANDLFAALVASAGIRDSRLWFVEVVMPSMSECEKAEWVAAAVSLESAKAFVRFALKDGRKEEFEMRSARATGQEAVQHSIVCVFVPSSGASARKKDESGIAKGQAMERARIRNELHQNVSQKLLGAAFGCKLLAGKIGGLNKGLAQEASDLAELLNAAVVDLQNLTQCGQEL